MAKVKYKAVFEEIWNSNKELFQKFFLLNTQYADLEQRNMIQNEFQQLGSKVQSLLKEGEGVLCGTMERSGKEAYSTRLADKYWNEVRKYFKYIDLVGVQIHRA